MKRRHKVSAGVGVALIGLATAVFQGWTEHERADRDRVAAENHAAHECEVKLCEAQGGEWWRTGCRYGVP